jgi:hypothetical protein
MVSRPSGHDHTKRPGNLGVSLGLQYSAFGGLLFMESVKFGKRVVVLAPSSPSVEVLRANGFAQADTLQQFQLSPKLQQTAEDHALWVNEAGFLSVQQLLELQEFALQTIVG